MIPPTIYYGYLQICYSLVSLSREVIYYILNMILLLILKNDEYIGLIINSSGIGSSSSSPTTTTLPPLLGTLLQFESFSIKTAASIECRL